MKSVTITREGRLFDIIECNARKKEDKLQRKLDEVVRQKEELKKGREE